MDNKIIIGIVAGLVVGTGASIYVNNVLYQGAPYHLEKVAFVAPIGVGAGVGYYLATK